MHCGLVIAAARLESPVIRESAGFEVALPGKPCKTLEMRLKRPDNARRGALQASRS